MALDLGFIMAFIGAAIAMLIGIVLFSSIADTLECESLPLELMQQCESSLDTAWTVIGILPVVLFFAIFSILGGGFGSLPSLPDLRKIGRRSHKKPKKITITQKIMIMLGLAKVTKL